MRKLLCAVTALLICDSMAIAAEKSKVLQAMEKLDSALAAEAQRLLTAKKEAEAQEVLAIQKAVQDQIMPLTDPGKSSALRARMFFEQLAANWSRPTNPDRFVFEKVQTPQGPTIKTKVVQPTGGIGAEGVLRLTGEDSAEIRWNNGITWKVYAAGTRRLLVEEFNGAVPSNDGIMLFR